MPPKRPRFLLKDFQGTLSGPINKKASFFMDVSDRDINSGTVINAVTADS